MHHRAFETPVLLLLYNRPRKVTRLLEALGEVRPARLWVSADGPRDGDALDADRCAETRALLTRIDWPCRMETRLADDHLGCRRAVTTALDWFFAQVERGIVLEDDCIPDATFFPYCDELLERYASDPRVLMIAGSSFEPDQRETAASYYFSRYGHVWGWATWRRAWALYDRTLDAARRGALDTWDVHWTYTVFHRGGLAAVPNRNLVSNVGFGDEATHTVATDSPFHDLPTRPLEFPLRHPTEVAMVERCRLLPSRAQIEMHPFRPGHSAASTPGGTAT